MSGFHYLKDRLERLDRAARHVSPERAMEAAVMRKLYQHVQTGGTAALAILQDSYFALRLDPSLAYDVDGLAAMLAAGGDGDSGVCLCRMDGLTAEEIREFLTTTWETWWSEAAHEIDRRDGKRVCSARAGKRPSGGV